MGTPGIVLGINPDGRGTEAEVVIRIGGEQCLIAHVDVDLLRRWGLTPGARVVVDMQTPGISIHPFHTTAQAA